MEIFFSEFSLALKFANCFEFLGRIRFDVHDSSAEIKNKLSVYINLGMTITKVLLINLRSIPKAVFFKVIRAPLLLSFEESSV